MRTVSLALAVSLAALGRTSAQDRPTLPLATHIRYSVAPGDSSNEAQVVAQRGDSLWVRPLRSADTVLLTIPSLTRLEINRGRKGHPVRGAVIGLVSGAVAGAVLGAAIGSDCGPDPYPGVHFGCIAPRDQAALVLAAYLGGAGAAAGAIVGALIRTDHWESAPLASRGSIALWRGEHGRDYGISFRYAVF
jgi:hypothetical protein